MCHGQAFYCCYDVGHYSDVLWAGMAMMLSTTMCGYENTLATVFVDLCLLAIGTECNLLQFVLVGQTLSISHSTV